MVRAGRPGRVDSVVMEALLNGLGHEDELRNSRRVGSAVLTDEVLGPFLRPSEGRDEIGSNERNDLVGYVPPRRALHTTHDRSPQVFCAPLRPLQPDAVRSRHFRAVVAAKVRAVNRNSSGCALKP
jgi:hypothetical protein